MAAPLRKPRKSAANASLGEKRRFVLRLSGPMTALLGTILAVAVGWSFFMGFMVGRGQNPETRVEQMTGMLGGPSASAKSAPAPANAPGAANAPGQDAPAQPGAAGADGQQPPQAAEKAPDGAPAAQPQQDQAAQKPAAPAYPFAHPTGNSLAAWGIKPGQQGAQQGQPAGQTTDQAGQASPARPQAQQPKASTGPAFDFVYQVAAFKAADDADKLRTTLEGKGLRTRTKKSGKLTLVMVSMRGTEDDAYRLREELQHMRLGVPIKILQKPVGKPAKKGR